MTQIKVLDSGYVELIESWGSDERIIEAARMSTGKGFNGWGGAPCPDCMIAGRLSKIDSLFVNYEAVEEAKNQKCKCKGTGKIIGDENLLGFLWNNRHSTPFEMAGMIIEVKAPIFVYREWHRHRTQCLTGDTLISLVQPRGTTFKRTIKEIFDLKYGGVVDNMPQFHKNGYSKAGTPLLVKAKRRNPWRTRILPSCQERVLRVLDEKTGIFHTSNMKDVWESGIKKVYKVKAGEYEVTASAEHPFFTERGWIKTKELKIGDKIARVGKVSTDGPPLPPSLRAGIGVWTSMMRNRLIKNVDMCYYCKEITIKENLELDHVVPVIENLKLALDENNLKPICIPCHKKKSAKEQPDRREQTRRGIRWELVNTLPEYVGEKMTYDLEVEGPHHNYIANDLVVHNSYNEMSGRYIALPNENYLPDLEDLLNRAKKAASTTNRQASGTGAMLTEQQADEDLQELFDYYTHGQELYDRFLSHGWPKELARLPVPVARYSRMRASANLRNWLAFLTLRMAPGAQQEIREYANVVGTLIAEKFPRTWKLFKAEMKL